MKQEINVYQFAQEFKNMNRDYYSWDGYQALYDYYDELSEELDLNYTLDVIGICCDVSEYTEDELVKDYGYLLDKKDYEDLDKEDFLSDLKIKLQDNTQFIELDNGSYLVWGF